jgi:poly-gamma-glutamate capsule biosynthesis protein CapA/YwtB (metallophosphatase superfamily)
MFTMPRRIASFTSTILGVLLCCASPAAEPQSDGQAHLVFVGDVMLDDGPGREIARGVDPLADFADLLTEADFTVGNLECVLATAGTKVEKPFNFRADPRCLPLLVRYFDAVSVANNHSGDFGPEALVEQCQRLEQAGLRYFGGGRNEADAHRPLVVEVRGLRIALLGYNEFKPRSFEATPSRAGVAWSVDAQVLDDLRLARSRYAADIVIPYMHWGSEGEPQPNERQRTLARAMIDAGADVVVGGHPHITEGAEYYHDHLIIYSLGNFVFDGFEEGPQRTGWLLRLTLNKRGLVAWDTILAHADDNGIPRRQRDAASPSGRAADSHIVMRVNDR